MVSIVPDRRELQWSSSPTVWPLDGMLIMELSKCFLHKLTRGRKSVSVCETEYVKKYLWTFSLNFPWRQNMLINYFCHGYNGKYLFLISSMYHSIYSQSPIEKHFVWEKAVLYVEGLNWTSSSCRVAICGCFPLQSEKPSSTPLKV